MKTLGLLILAALGLLVLLLLIALARTLLTGAKRSDWAPERDPEREALCAEKLSKMVQVETVSRLGEDAECAARAREMIGRVAAPWGLGADFGEWLRSANAFAPALCESLAFRADVPETQLECRSKTDGNAQ